jgi:hypothetical protein
MQLSKNVCFVFYHDLKCTWAEKGKEQIVEGGSEKVKIGILKNKKNSNIKFF